MQIVRWIWALVLPLVYPIASLPVTLPFLLIKPLRLVLALVLTGLLAVDFTLALVVAVILGSWLVASVFLGRPVPGTVKRDKWTEFAEMLSPAIQAVLFVVLMDALGLGYVLRWFAAFFGSYYVSAVVLGYMTLPNATRRDAQPRTSPVVRSDKPRRTNPASIGRSRTRHKKTPR